MARPLEFDVSTALDKALVLFWRKGYQATSLADLLEAMGIGRSSFYAAFGDKRTLFLSCLDLFAERTKDVVARTRLRMAPLDALQYFFERNFVGPGATKAHLGCMLVNTVLEMADVDAELSARAGSHLADMQIVFEECLLEAGCAPDHDDGGGSGAHEHPGPARSALWKRCPHGVWRGAWGRFPRRSAVPLPHRGHLGRWGLCSL